MGSAHVTGVDIAVLRVYREILQPCTLENAIQFSNGRYVILLRDARLTYPDTLLHRFDGGGKTTNEHVVG